MSDFATLRIIAADAELTAIDRAALIAAADDYDQMHRLCAQTERAAEDAARHARAMKDRLLETERKLENMQWGPWGRFWSVRLGVEK